MVYFDNNATTPLGLSALHAFKIALDQDWHNPSSPYRASARTRAILDRARFDLTKSFGLKKKSSLLHLELPSPTMQSSLILEKN
jgi:cysteine sulfinate desulfinase/cysteine desulfurase-like protein